MFVIALIVLIWAISGLLGFIMSLICLGYKGSASHKFIGFILAFLFGPFYWLYYIYNSNYCLKNS
jgi:hypothetical protein